MTKKSDCTANEGVSGALEPSSERAVVDDAAASSSEDGKVSVSSKAVDEGTSATEQKRSLGSRLSNFSIGIKGMTIAVAVAVMVLVITILGVQLHSKSDEVERMNAQSAANATAEKIALDYASGAADMDFNNLEGWRGRLVEGTTPELTNRLTQAAASMEQIIVPLQWISTAQPIAAKVSSETDGVFNVDCFVNVLTKNSQAPDGIQSTATYKLTVNKNDGWAITEISGIDSALGSNEEPK